MEPVSEKKFTIVDSPEMCTLAFLINKPEEGTSYCTLQKLDCTFPDSTNRAKKMFNFDSLSDEQKNVVLLTIGGEKAFLNYGVLLEDKFLMSKSPMNVGFRVIYDADTIGDKEVRYTPNFKRPISIIDPETAEEVKPVLYYDEGANMVKAKIKLQPKKSYIALEIKDE